MRSDLDRLMAERAIDAFVVEGPDGLNSANSDFNYFVRGAHLTGTVIKKRGEPAMLLHSPWEEIQAASTGLVLVPTNRWNLRDITNKLGDRLQAQVELRRQIFQDLGIGGRVAFYGTVHAGPNFALLAGLGQKVPGLEIVAEFEKTLIDEARVTKDPEEVEIMRRVGRKTCAVVQAVIDFIKTGHASGDTLVDDNGKPITIGDVKQLMRREMAAQGLDEPLGTIFSQGRDSGLPHANGDESAALKLGQSIVFDIYPREQASGYHHDMTRTYAIGYATPELQKLYDDVQGVFDYVVSEFEVGAPTKPYQDMVCAYFEARGHATIGSKYPIEEGYIHALGHGIGLEVHEDYGFPSFQDRGDVLKPGAVFTVEPGLYYPSKGLGTRIEDTFYCTPSGEFENLTPLPKELVIPIKG